MIPYPPHDFDSVLSLDVASMHRGLFDMPQTRVTGTERVEPAAHNLQEGSLRPPEV